MKNKKIYILIFLIILTLSLNILNNKKQTEYKIKKINDLEQLYTNLENINDNIKKLEEENNKLDDEINFYSTKIKAINNKIYQYEKNK